MAQFERSKEWKLRANRIIREHPQLQFIKQYGIKVDFLVSDEKKIENKRTILGQCAINKDGWKSFYIPYDFVIIIYEENLIGASEESKDILIWHELEHIGVDENNEFYIRPHDYEEFKDIIDSKGLDWYNYE